MTPPEPPYRGQIAMPSTHILIRIFLKEMRGSGIDYPQAASKEVDPDWEHKLKRPHCLAHTKFGSRCVCERTDGQAHTGPIIEGYLILINWSYVCEQI